MARYELQMLMGGVWSGVVEDGQLVETVTHAINCQSLSKALRACDRHAHARLTWHNDQNASWAAIPARKVSVKTRLANNSKREAKP